MHRRNALKPGETRKYTVNAEAISKRSSARSKALDEELIDATLALAEAMQDVDGEVADYIEGELQVKYGRGYQDPRAVSAKAMRCVAQRLAEG